ncbi:DUF882 domain-containing protein [Desulfopila sp. IMCC35006]|nr:DUF882 domain-containing protein [Desulfopila sp. IMCC35006]
MTEQKNNHSMNRRTFLLRAAQLAVGLSLTEPLDLLARTFPNNIISFFHTHTEERFDLRFDGRFCPRSTKIKLFSFLRDFRTGDVHPIDLGLMKILLKIQKETGSKGVCEVISGYRSPKTNASLRSRSSGVARNSLHLQGKAIDIRLSDVPTKELRDAAISLKAGGVGYYAKSDFVHIDTGDFRTW